MINSLIYLKGVVNKIRFKKLLRVLTASVICMSSCCFNANVLASSEEFNYWIEDLEDMPTARGYLACATIDGKIYAIGGNKGSTRYGEIEVYDPVTNTWEVKKSTIPTLRNSLRGVVYNGKLYALGGYNGKTRLATVEVYDPVTDTWEEKTPMKNKRSGFAASVVDGKIYCIGGVSTSSTYLNSVEIYDIATDTWTTGASMPTTRTFINSVVIDGEIYVIGGYDGVERLNTVEVYNPKTNKWREIDGMPTKRSGFSAEVVNGRIYVMGGYDGTTTLKNIDEYNPKTKVWTSKKDMGVPRDNFATAVVDKKVYCIGGMIGPDYTNMVQAYVAVELSQEEKATDKVILAEKKQDRSYIQDARESVNNLNESMEKDRLQSRLDKLSSNELISNIVNKSKTSNADVYIAGSNVLGVSLDTNSVEFSDFSGTEDMEARNALSLTVNSSLPYNVKASLVSGIMNEDGTSINKDILSIKTSKDNDYKTLASSGVESYLLNNVSAGLNVHILDMKLAAAILNDTYRASVKLEVSQI